MNLHFNREVTKLIKECRGGPVEVLRRAIGLYHYFDEKAGKGDTLSLMNTDGEVKKVIVWE